MCQMKYKLIYYLVIKLLLHDSLQTLPLHFYGMYVVQ